MSLPDRPLSNFKNEKAVKELGIRGFRGVFMSDTLPKKPLKDECGILRRFRWTRKSLAGVGKEREDQNLF